MRKHQPPYVINYWIGKEPGGLFCFTRQEEKAIMKYIKKLGGKINSSMCGVHNTWNIEGRKIITTIPHYEEYDEIRPKI